jgi:hypothetical protein
MNDKERLAWEKWERYVEERYDTIVDQLHLYQPENLPFTRNLAAELGMECTPKELETFAELIRTTIERISYERFKNDE